MKDHLSFKQTLEQGFWDYWNRKKTCGEFSEYMLDPESGQGRLPVFKMEFADRNVLMKRSATDKEKSRILSLLPRGKRHKWFRSMNSSQALALSFFGNLVVYGQLDWLGDLKDDNGEAIFGTADLSPYNFSLEHEIVMLNEPRPTSLDVFISGRYRVAVECKLTEPEVGECSRPDLKEDSREFCNGSYSIQRGRTKRCALTEIGVRYWEYVPTLFNWPAEINHNQCPLKDNYQLVRNVLAACVREDGIVSSGNGHAVLVYDKRNPAFGEGGKGSQAFRRTHEGLQDPKNLRKMSWQRIFSFMKQNDLLNWLTSAIFDKYGISAGD